LKLEKVISDLQKKTKDRQTWSDFWLLGLVIILGTILRVTLLTSKPPWTDEFATMVFSLGNNYNTVPLNQIISLETLLQPLKINNQASIADVIKLVIQEDNHPPLYFIFAYFWHRLFNYQGEYVSLGIMRSLAVFWGVLSIPLIYLISRFIFKSRLIANLAAILIAVSPYAVFVSQEARHYTLAILFVLVSLGCFLRASQNILNQKILPYPLVFGWLIINCLGLSVHYFFSLTILAQGITLLLISIKQVKQKCLWLTNWWRLSLVFLGNLSFMVIWFFTVIPQDYGNQMTAWIQRDNQSFLAIISPFFQLLGTLITMLSLLPVEAESLPVILVSGAIMIGFFLWIIPQLKTAWQSSPQPELRLLASFFLSAIAVFFFITYILSMDITRGARYSFVYFPAVMLILSILLANCWQRQQKKLVTIVILMALISSVSVTFNLGYRKYYRPDQLVNIIQTNNRYPLLIITSYKSLVQVGEMMGIAWEFRHRFPELKPHFMLVTPEKQPNINLQSSQPFEVWLVNFRNSIDLSQCQAVNLSSDYVTGYEYQKFLCGR
jgi:uncharacterized membrane protein